MRIIARHQECCEWRLEIAARRIVSLLVCSVRMCVLSLISCPVVVAAIPDELPLELKAYEVQTLVAFDTPLMGTEGKQELLDEIRQTAARCVGSQWLVTLNEAAWLQPASATGLARLSMAKVLEHSPPATDQVDVWQVATVRTAGAGWRVAVRSWQPNVAVESEVVSADCSDRSELALTVLRLSYAAFRPVGVIDNVDGKQVTVLLRAGVLAVPDESFALSKAATLFIPVLASRKRDKTIDRLQPIPWTFLSVTETDGARLTCDVHSGIRSAIGSKKNGRVETLAIGVKSSFPNSQLELATQARPSLPLVAHRIELRKTGEFPKPDESRDNDDRLIKVLLTDRRGHVVIPAGSSEDVIWLFAYSGNHLLARVPTVPGIAATMKLEVPDDSARLAAESDLYMLQGELVEAVAARNTAAAAVRIAIKKNDATRAKQAVADLKKLPDAQVYLDRVTAIRIPSIKIAQSRKDRAGEVRIKRMCDEMTELIKQYLSEDKRLAVLEELKELFADDEAVEKPVKQGT
ncbi:MAG: hypothetical protein JWP89_4622 [Schlesneria sp.]|nr:hypothetical protein [Schlesneria sp.]